VAAVVFRAPYKSIFELCYIMHTSCTGTDQVLEVSKLESSSRREAGSGLVEQVESNGRR